MYQDVKFLDLKSVSEIESFKNKSQYPIPVQLEENAKEINIECIASGLIKVIAEDAMGLKSVKQFKDCSDKQINEAYEAYKSMLLEIHPNIETELSMGGIAKTKAKDFEFAKMLFNAAKNLKHSSLSYVNLAVMYAQMTADFEKEKKDTQASETDELIFKTLVEGLKYNVDDADLLVELGGYHLRHQEMEIAYECFEKALKGVGDGDRKKQIEQLMKDMKVEIDQENTILAAIDQIMMGNEEKALLMIEEFLKLEPLSWEGYYVKGWALRCLQKYEEANEALLISVSKNPDVSATYNELAICAKEFGDTQMAKEYLSMAIEREEDNVIYLANLAYLYLAEKDFDSARYYLEKARAIDENDAQVQDLIEEYEVITGEKIADVVIEQSVSKEEIDEMIHHHAEEV